MQIIQSNVISNTQQNNKKKTRSTRKNNENAKAGPTYIPTEERTPLKGVLSIFKPHFRTNTNQSVKKRPLKRAK